MIQKERSVREVLAHKKWLYHMYCTYKQHSIPLIAACMFQSISYIGIAWCLEKITNVFHQATYKNVVVNHFFEPIQFDILWLILFTICSSIACYLSIILKTKISAGMVLEMKRDMFEQFQKIKVKELEKIPIGEIVSKFTSDVVVLENFLSANISSIIYAPCSVLFMSIFMIHISAKLYVASCLMIPVIIFISGAIGKSLTQLSIRLQTNIGKSTNLVIEGIDGVSVIKSFNLQEKYTDKFKIVTMEIFKNGLNIILRLASLTPFLYVIRSIPKIVCITYGGYLIYHGELEAGDILAFLVALGIMANNLYQLPNIVMDYFKTNGVIKNIRSVFGIPTEEVDSKETNQNCLEPEVYFQHINFAYENHKNIVSDIDFIAKRHRITAIVGESGCGKTTLLKLLLGYYKVDSGEIQIGSMKLEESSIKNWCKQIAFVSQDTYLFPDTIYNNIACAYEGATKEEVYKAAKEAQIHEFIIGLEQGYETMVSEKGSNFSGGEKQRIALARALVKPCSIIVLDEPTSAVDVESEKKITNSLKKIKKNKTIIMVSHRLSTIEVADDIYVLRDGRMVEQGNVFSLMNEDSYFKQLYATTVSNAEGGRNE